jgi:hypothetical protein
MFDLYFACVFIWPLLFYKLVEFFYMVGPAGPKGEKGENGRKKKKPHHKFHRPTTKKPK